MNFKLCWGVCKGRRRGLLKASPLHPLEGAARIRSYAYLSLEELMQLKQQNPLKVSRK